MISSDFKDKVIPVLAAVTSDPETLFLALNDRYKSARAVIAADVSELASIPGFSESTAIFLKTAFALGSRRVTDRFKFGRTHSEEEIIEYLKALLVCRANEAIYCLLLDDRKRVLSCEFISEGTVDTSFPMPRKMLERAMNKKAKYIIIAHNHPEGEALASASDVEATRGIALMLLEAGINLICHYVISGDTFEKILPSDI